MNESLSYPLPGRTSVVPTNYLELFQTSNYMFFLALQFRSSIICNAS